jgi:hypothetical protein
MHVYEVRPRKDHRGGDLISGALRFGRLRRQSFARRDFWKALEFRVRL